MQARHQNSSTGVNFMVLTPKSDKKHLFVSEANRIFWRILMKHLLSKGLTPSPFVETSYDTVCSTYSERDKYVRLVSHFLPFSGFAGEVIPSYSQSSECLRATAPIVHLCSRFGFPGGGLCTLSPVRMPNADGTF